MKNVDMKVEGNTLVIRVDLTESHGISASGKSEVIATTSGNQSVPGHDDIKIGLNCYRRLKDREKS